MAAAQAARRVGSAGAVAIALLVATTTSAWTQQTHALEYAVKAAYLYKFAPFVEWPASAFPSPSSPFYVCVLGEDPFGGALDQAVSGQHVDQHPAMVRRLQSPEASAGCHILYLGGASAKSAADALRDVRGAPVLTVSDQDRGVNGTIIQFVVKNNRVRFDVDTEAASVNRVMISSKLLSLANAIKPGT